MILLHPARFPIPTNTSKPNWFRSWEPTATETPNDRTSWHGQVAWDAFQIKKTWRVIVGVAAVSIAVSVVLPFLRGGGRELNTEDIVARSEAAVAFIQGVESSGSEFLIAKGLVITNAHVLDDHFMDNVKVHFPSATANDKGPLKAPLVDEDSQRDLAVLSIDTKATPLKIAEAFAFRPGQDITVIGSPGIGGHVFKNAVSRGVMSTETEINSQRFYQLGVAVNPGNSGGPVFDSYGDVVGVVTARATELEGLAFSVPLSDVRSVVAIASQPGAGVVEKATSRHQVEVVARRIASASRILLVATHSYSDEIAIANECGRRARQAGRNLDFPYWTGSGAGRVLVRAGQAPEELDTYRAHALLNAKVDSANAQLVDSGAKALVPMIVADQHLSEGVRSRFVDLWNNYGVLWTYYRGIRRQRLGDVSTHRARNRQLEDQHMRAIEALKESLGLTDL